MDGRTGSGPGSGKWESVFFPLRFFGWALAFYSLVKFNVSILPVLQEHTSRAVAAGAKLTALSTDVQPGFVLGFAGGQFSYEISTACTAWAPAALFVAAVFAYPARWRQRFLGAAMGLPLIFALNILRLVSMAWIGVAWPSIYEHVHGFWWQAFIILAIGLGWLLWARGVEAERRGTPERGRVRALALAVAIFLVAVAILEVVGSLLGAPAAYARLLERVVGFRLMGAEFSYPLLYGGLCAAVALYVAAPRVPARKRILGALALGVPLQFAFEALMWTLYKAQATGAISPLEDGSMVSRIFPMAGSAVAWHLWARRNWVEAKHAGPPSCPACHVRTEALLEHIASSHRAGQRHWRKAALRKYPGLRPTEDGPPA